MEGLADSPPLPHMEAPDRCTAPSGARASLQTPGFLHRLWSCVCTPHVHSKRLLPAFISVLGADSASPVLGRRAGLVTWRERVSGLWQRPEDKPICSAVLVLGCCGIQPSMCEGLPVRCRADRGLIPGCQAGHPPMPAFAVYRLRVLAFKCTASAVLVSCSCCVSSRQVTGAPQPPFGVLAAASMHIERRCC